MMMTPQPLIAEPLIPKKQEENLALPAQNIGQPSKFLCVSRIILKVISVIIIVTGAAYGLFALAGLIIIDFTNLINNFEFYSYIYLHQGLLVSCFTFSSICSFGIAFFLIVLGGNCWRTLRDENYKSLKWNLRFIQGCFLIFIILFGIKSIFDYICVNSLSNDLQNQIDKIPYFINYLQQQFEDVGEPVPNFVFEYYSGKIVGNHTYKKCTFLDKYSESSLPYPEFKVVKLNTFMGCFRNDPYFQLPEFTTSMDGLLAIMRPGMLTIFLVSMLLTFIGIFIWFIIFVAGNKFLNKSKYGCCNNCQPDSKDIVPIEIK